MSVKILNLVVDALQMTCLQLVQGDQHARLSKYYEEQWSSDKKNIRDEIVKGIKDSCTEEENQFRQLLHVLDDIETLFARLADGFKQFEDDRHKI